jgi:prepilin-type N-terminal cleavage/methylation domain-containing protein/prepilin-type processing-associated H-X9-DG protein
MNKIRAKTHAFTLVELLVVIGIIAVLISILLPSLGKAREHANTVKCMSNLRQVYLATELYASKFNGYTMPSTAGTGSAREYNWWGINVLGAAFGVRRVDDSSAGQIATVEAIARMIDCPSLQRDKDPAISFSADFTYNGNLGDFRAHDKANGSYATYKEWAFFKKRVNVPGNVIVALDAAAQIADDDDRFESLANLTTASPPGRPLPRAGRPHSGMANVLFHDGGVRTIRAFDPTKTPNTVLADWMIRYPRPGDSATTLRDSRWDKTKGLPF